MSKQIKHLQMKNFVNKYVDIYSSDSKYSGIMLSTDSHMNVVIKDCVEVQMKSENKRLLGLIMLKGDQIQFIVPSNIQQQAIVVAEKKEVVKAKVNVPKLPGGLKGLPGLRK
ncbi:LSM_domain-containing protein [Hexamita inflata]|uniref:LSM domain-containing protein n=1 Tax=Hexamita inflata TaxID=28002 RepID=A0AA86UMH1_9EUKA|nr:LSM domain-containing protein [Hexamita inflata]